MIDSDEECGFHFRSLGDIDQYRERKKVFATTIAWLYIFFPFIFDYMFYKLKNQNYFLILAKNSLYAPWKWVR